MNAKNQLLEFLAGRGMPASYARFSSTQAGAGAWTSTVVITLPGREPVTGIGTSYRKSQADITAAKDALPTLKLAEAAAALDWAHIYAEAQAGDALLKLAGYLASGLASPEERSLWLQGHESDASLAQVFDQWFDEGAPELVPYGRGLGEKNKATLVEAVIWRRYGARVLGPAAAEALGELRDALASR